MLLLELRTLMELDIPDTEYGYWITGQGKLIPVDREAHVKVAAQYLGRSPLYGAGEPTYKEGEHPYELAAKAGWIRVIYQPMARNQRLSADITTPTTRARIALIQLLKEYRPILNDVVINVATGGVDPDAMGWKSHDFTGMNAGAQAMRFVMQMD